jgi:phenylpropionate dioxygenase-like ring-hydroxylating dioxygenase large terminal subunit
MFLRNAWYVAAWDHEVSADALLGRILLNEPVVLYRTRDGQLVALEDRCCHRHYPLHKGTLTQDCIQCRYHGFTYDGSGRCVRVPGQSNVPEAARVKSYPVIERHRWVWVWMGDPARADESKIVDFHWLNHPEWRAKGTTFHVKSNYELILENLLDLTHLTFLHGGTIGTYATAENAEVTTRATDHDVTVTRWIMDSPAPATYVKARGFASNIDRWQFINFTPPCYVRLDIGGLAIGQRARERKTAAFAAEGLLADGLEMRNLNAFTPETEKTTHYFWAQAHNFSLDDPSVTDMLFDQIDEAFHQDWEVFETQQHWIDLAPTAPRINVRADAGQVQSVRLLHRKIEEEGRWADQVRE